MKAIHPAKLTTDVRPFDLRNVSECQFRCVSFAIQSTITRQYNSTKLCSHEESSVAVVGNYLGPKSEAKLRLTSFATVESGSSATKKTRGTTKKATATE